MLAWYGQIPQLYNQLGAARAQRLIRRRAWYSHLKQEVVTGIWRRWHSSTSSEFPHHIPVSCSSIYRLWTKQSHPVPMHKQTEIKWTVWIFSLQIVRKTETLSRFSQSDVVSRFPPGTRLSTNANLHLIFSCSGAEALIMSLDTHINNTFKWISKQESWKEGYYPII